MEILANAPIAIPLSHSRIVRHYYATVTRILSHTERCERIYITRLIEVHEYGLDVGGVIHLNIHVEALLERFADYGGIEVFLVCDLSAH